MPLCVISVASTTTAFVSTSVAVAVAIPAGYLISASTSIAVITTVIIVVVQFCGGRRRFHGCGCGGRLHRGGRRLCRGGGS